MDDALQVDSSSSLGGAKDDVIEVEDDEPAAKKMKFEADRYTVIDCSKSCESSESPVEKHKVNNASCVSSNDTVKNNETNDIKLSSSSNSNTDDGKILKEKDAGITEFLQDYKGFTAIIKQRYSDFLVNEIDTEGNVVRLTNTTYEPPAEEEQDVDKSDQQTPMTDDVISEAKMAEIQQMVDIKNKDGCISIPISGDKETRTKIHLAVKKRFTELETKTVERDGEKFIQVLWKKGKQRDRERDDWPKCKKSCRYVKFVLYKENKDTMDAISLIAKNLKVKEGMFQYAGTKDKRGKTSQEVTAHRIHPKKLNFLNKMLWGIQLGNFRFVSEPLKLGQLSGNKFQIVLRNVQGDTSVVDTALQSLRDNGFINFFGMQRFGTTSIPTFQVGSTLLSGDWSKAIDLILMPRQDKSSKSKFQSVWAETKDPVETLKVTPNFCGLERNILHGLSQNMKPFNALEKISRNTRLLYVHSYQSFIWNKMTSRRLKDLGVAPIEGDLVLKASKQGKSEGEPTVVTKENLQLFSLEDVVLPLPGHSVIYPHNQVSGWYTDELKKDNLDINNMKRQQKDYSLPGAYRHVVVKPWDVEWRHHRYDDFTKPLILSDLETLNGESLTHETEGKLSATIVEMSLPVSCYATMALREVMKIDTSAVHQATLNTDRS